MYANLWTFLSIGAVLGVLFAMFVVYINYKKTLKALEIEALKIENENSQATVKSLKMKEQI